MRVLFPVMFLSLCISHVYLLVPNRGRSMSRLYIVTCLFNLYAEYIMRNIGLDETQAGIKISGKISITSDMQMTLLLWQKVKN